MQPYKSWDFCNHTGCTFMVRSGEQRKTLCRDCKAYQMYTYLREHGQVLEEGSGIQAELARLQVALEATIAEKENLKLHWVPVEERLPEESGPYLCWYQDGFGNRGAMVGYWDEFRKGFYPKWPNNPSRAEKYWMPLPASPKEASK